MMTEISDAKLQRFVDSIIDESSADAQEILKELEEKREEKLTKIRASLDTEVAQYYERRSTEIKARERARVSAKTANDKHELLELREKCAVSAFAETRKKIAEFTASEQYPEHLAALLNKAISALGYGFAAEVRLRPEDMKYTDFLLGSVSGVSLGFSEGNFMLGGLQLICQARGLRIDLSFDSAMTDLVGHFSELTGMQVEE
jgi:vacuolar-type H+-ATPase subunit E/Vma4